MAFHLCPILQEQQFDQNGVVLVGGKIYFYLAGTTTPTPIYSDDAGTVQSNPVVLNSRGAPDFAIWLNDTISYKAVLKSPLDAFIAQYDDLSGVNNATSSTLGIEWTASAMTPTYLSATQFSVTGDQTPTLQVGRRLRCVVSAGTIYGTITASSYAVGNTTVTFAGDSLTLDSGLSSFSYGTLAPTNSSIPKTYTDGWGGTATGAVNAYAISVSPAIGAYAAGQTFRFVPNLTNTSATPTLNVNGLGAKTIKSRSLGGLVATPVGYLVAGQEIGVTYDGTYFVVDVATAAAGSQTFTANGTFTVPICNYLRVICVGGGGGGGSGTRWAAANTRHGGGGGGGGGLQERTFPAGQVGGSGASIAVTVGTGGAGGAAILTDNTAGQNGADGTASSFGSFLSSNFGAKGAGGTGAGGGGGGWLGNGTGSTGGGTSPFNGGDGGAASTDGTSVAYGSGGGGGMGTGAVGRGGSSYYGCGGGGGGGHISAADVVYAGSAGGGTSTLVAGTGGAGGGVGNDGTAGTADPMTFAGRGGGGGGASATSAGGAGGAGAAPGGGGGGGGGSLNGFASGAGGAGGRGEVHIYWW